MKPKTNNSTELHNNEPSKHFTSKSLSMPNRAIMAISYTAGMPQAIFVKLKFLGNSFNGIKTKINHKELSHYVFDQQHMTSTKKDPNKRIGKARKTLGNQVYTSQISNYRHKIGNTYKYSNGSRDHIWCKEFWLVKSKKCDFH